MVWHRYSRWSTFGDMALALPTLGFFGYVLAARTLAWWGYGLVAAIMVATAWFFGLALLRSLSRFAWSGEAVMIQRPGQAVRCYDWSALSGLRLRHYGSRRKQEEGRGRVELRLDFADKGTLTLDSSLEGFAQLAALAEAGAKKNRLDLDEAVWEGLAVVASEGGNEPSSLGEETDEKSKED